MAIFDASFGIGQQEFDMYYKDITDAELLILKYQALDFLFFTKGMFKELSEDRQANKLKIISKNYIHNVLFLIKAGEGKLLEREVDDFKKFAKRLASMSPVDFQKYILTERTWGVQNKNTISIIEDFINKNGQQELDIIKGIIWKLKNPSFDTEKLAEYLESIK